MDKETSKKQTWLLLAGSVAAVSLTITWWVALSIYQWMARHPLASLGTSISSNGWWALLLIIPVGIMLFKYPPKSWRTVSRRGTAEAAPTPTPPKKKWEWVEPISKASRSSGFWTTVGVITLAVFLIALLGTTYAERLVVTPWLVRLLLWTGVISTLACLAWGTRFLKLVPVLILALLVFGTLIWLNPQGYGGLGPAIQAKVAGDTWTPAPEKEAPEEQKGKIAPKAIFTEPGFAFFYPQGGGVCAAKLKLKKEEFPEVGTGTAALSFPDGTLIGYLRGIKTSNSWTGEWADEVDSGIFEVKKVSSSRWEGWWKGPERPTTGKLIIWF